MGTIDNPSYLPNLQVIFEEMRRQGWLCQGQITRDLRFRGVRLYHGQVIASRMLYVLEPEAQPSFPTDSAAYLCAGSVPGNADHICCGEHSPREILEFVQDLFEAFLDQKERLDRLLAQDAGLNALCALGEKLLGNPVFVHDDWFVIIAKSPSAAQFLPTESRNSSVLEYLPKKWVEEFQFDSGFQETYGTTAPCIWNSIIPDISARSIYVNLTESNTYRGRLLVMEHDRPFRTWDLLLTEQLHAHAAIIMRCRQRNPYSKIRSMDSVVNRLLEGSSVPESDEALFLSALRWQGADPLICIRMENQQRDGNAPLEHALHSALFGQLADSYILYSANQQCAIVNLAKNDLSMAMLSHLLSPLCRDYCHYAGISSPVSGIRELRIAYTQAGIALEQAFQKRDASWVVPFSACALKYMLTHLEPPFQPRHLIAPQLLQLLEEDAGRGTSYFETLRTYLVKERDIPRTSEALIIHRTTLLYRLKKIQGALGLNLEDPDTRLYLLLSFKILEQENRIPPMP